MGLAACERSGAVQPSPPAPPAKAADASAPPPAQPAPPRAPSRPPPPPAEFRAGLLAPLSGAHAPLGEAMLNAAQMALFDAAGENFVLLPADTQGDAPGAMAAARRVLAERARILLGPVFGKGAIAAAEAARREAAPVFAFSNDPAALRRGVWLFGLPPEAEVERLIALAAARGRVRLGVLAFDTGFGRHVGRAAAAAAARHGVTFVRSAFLEGGLEPAALSEQVRRFTGAPSERERERGTEEPPPPFDAVLLAAPGEALGQVAALLAFHGLDPALVQYLGVGVRPEDAPRDEASLAGAWYAAAPAEAFEQFAARYERAYASRPPRLAAFAYDATALAAVLAGKDGALDIAALTAPEGFYGASGAFRFRRDGSVERKLAVFEIAPEGPRILDPAPENFPDSEYRPLG